MPAIDITGAEVSGNTLIIRILYDNDQDMEAEVSGSLGGAGINASFPATSVPANTVDDTSFGIAVDSSFYGEELLVTATLSEAGANTGAYPGVDEQRNLTVNSDETVDLSSPLFGGGGTVDQDPDDGGDTGPTGDPENDIDIRITQETQGGEQYAQLQYEIENFGSNTISATVGFSPSGASGSQEIFQLSPGETTQASVEWYFDNQQTTEEQLCVDLQSASYV